MLNAILLSDEEAAARRRAAADLLGPPVGPLGRFRRTRLGQARYSPLLDVFALTSPPQRGRDEKWDGDEEMLDARAIEELFDDGDLPPNDEQAVLFLRAVIVDDNDDEAPPVVKLTRQCIRCGDYKLRWRELATMDDVARADLEAELGLSIFVAGRYLVVQCDDCGPARLHYRSQPKAVVKRRHYFLLRKHKGKWRVIMAD